VIDLSGRVGDDWLGRAFKRLSAATAIGRVRPVIGGMEGPQSVVSWGRLPRERPDMRGVRAPLCSPRFGSSENAAHGFSSSRTRKRQGGSKRLHPPKAGLFGLGLGRPSSRSPSARASASHSRGSFVAGKAPPAGPGDKVAIQPRRLSRPWDGDRTWTLLKLKR